MACAACSESYSASMFPMRVLRWSTYRNSGWHASGDGPSVTARKIERHVALYSAQDSDLDGTRSNLAAAVAAS